MFRKCLTGPKPQTKIHNLTRIRATQKYLNITLLNTRIEEIFVNTLFRI